MSKNWIRDFDVKVLGEHFGLDDDISLKHIKRWYKTGTESGFGNVTNHKKLNMISRFDLRGN